MFIGWLLNVEKCYIMYNCSQMPLFHRSEQKSVTKPSPEKKTR